MAFGGIAKSLSRAWPGVLLVLIGIGYSLLGFDRGLNVYDEGVPVYGALRVLEGELPYRDFWTIYPPGQFLLLAAAFRVFGVSLMVERLLSVVIIALVSALVWGLARQVLAPVHALLVWALWAFAFGAIELYGTTLPTALVASLVGWWLFLAFLVAPSPRRLVASGAALGAAMLLKQDIALYGLAAEAAVVLGFTMCGPREPRRRAGLALTRLALLFAGVAAVVVPAVAALALAMPLGAVFDEVLWFPLTGFASARRLAPPPLLPSAAPLWSGQMDPWTYFVVVHHSVRFYFPFAVLLLAAGWAVRSFRRSSAAPAAVEAPADGWALAFLGVLCVSLLGYARVRSDMAHIVPAWIPALTLFVALATRLAGPAAVRWLRVTAVTVVGLVFVVPSLWLKLLVGAHALFGPPMSASDLPRARGLVMSTALASLGTAAREVQAVVPAGEPIFVGNARHDRIVLNDVMFYFLAERPSATRYHELHPGVATRHDVQLEIAGELERRRVRWVVLRRDRRVEPGGELFNTPEGAHELDRYIRATFVPVRELGSYSLWQRRASWADGNVSP